MKVKSKHTETKGHQHHIHIERHDTWNVDSTLATVILANLLSFREKITGIPSSFLPPSSPTWHNDQLSFGFDDESINELAEKQWDATVDKMIWAFYQLTFDWEDQYYYGTYEWGIVNQQFIDPTTNKTIEYGKMVDKNPDGHWIDYEGMYEHNRRIQEGIDLFAKYYRNLWV